MAHWSANHGANERSVLDAIEQGEPTGVLKSLARVSSMDPPVDVHGPIAACRGPVVSGGLTAQEFQSHSSKPNLTGGARGGNPRFCPRGDQPLGR